MSLKPWREIARPHRDVLEGTFKQSEFAADITQVANGKAPREYQMLSSFLHVHSSLRVCVYCWGQ